MITVREDPWVCSNCGARHDAATNTEGDEAPEDGKSLSKCSFCGQLHMRNGGKWEKITDEEMSALPEQSLRHLAKVEALRQLFVAEKQELEKRRRWKKAR